MMPKQLPDLWEDEGFKRMAKEYADRVMERKAKIRKNSVIDPEEWAHDQYRQAYLWGAQEAFRYGYNYASQEAEKTLHETIQYYQKKVVELGGKVY